MARDRRLLSEMQSGSRSWPVVRMYLWDRPTVSLGANQVASEVIDLSQVERLGYDLVTRPTGGRALLHKGDLCYAVVAHRSHHRSFHSLTSTYRAIGDSLVDMLRLLGIDLPDVPTGGSESRRSLNPCFAMLSPFEVTVGGRKICGSAQFRSGGYFLQHGSIRLRDVWNHDDLTSIWPKGYGVDPDQITCVDRELGAAVDVAEVEVRLLESLEKNFHIKMVSI